jgi:hypothetical protein
MNASSGETPEDSGDSDTQKMLCWAAVGRVKWPSYLDHPGGQRSASTNSCTVKLHDIPGRITMSS